MVGVVCCWVAVVMFCEGSCCARTMDDDLCLS